MKVFTTGQIAKICNVAPRTVSKWFDSGRLKGYRIPGSQDRRVPREYLIQFLRENGMPLGEFEDRVLAKVLVVSKDDGLLEALTACMTIANGFKFAAARSIFDVGICLETLGPDCVVVDFEMGMQEAESVCRNLVNSAQFSGAIIVALLPDGAQNTLGPFVKEAFKKPLDANLLADRVRTLTATAKGL
jgi:excisionase family DNA binding protein